MALYKHMVVYIIVMIQVACPDLQCLSRGMLEKVFNSKIIPVFQVIGDVIGDVNLILRM